jgi:hypothetical protein
LISKLDAAKRQLDCAISLFLSKQDSLAIHTLAYAAYRLVHDHHPKNVKAILEEFERIVSFRAIPNFLKHANSDAGAILDDHSLETTWLTIAVAIRLWNELGQQKTNAMLEFAKLPNPYKPGHQASAAFEYVQHGSISDPNTAAADLQEIASLPSTGGLPRKP